MENQNINRNQYPIRNNNVQRPNQAQDNQQRVVVTQPGQVQAPVTNPVLKGYVEKFFDALKGLSPAHKIDLIYKNLTGGYPDQKANLEKKLNRILYEQEFGKKIRETNAFLNNNKKQFSWPWKSKSEMKSSTKKPEEILVFFISITNELLGPKLYPIYSSNMIIVKNSPYELDPRAVLRFGKYKAIVIKEIDRRPVSNLDLEEVRRRGDSTASDEFLIKAAMRAITTVPPKKEMNKAVLIIIGVLVVGALIYFFAK
jgi:hypothetical protein